MARRLNYLHYLVNLPEDGLLYNFFLAQVKTPMNGDCILTVKENMDQIGLGSDINELKRYKLDQFKKKVKVLIYKAAYKYLLQNLDRKDNGVHRSKMRDLHYDKLEMQKYLKTNSISKVEAQTLYKFRTKMEDFSDNFGSTDTCGLCLENESDDSQQHFLTCSKIISEMLPEGFKLDEKVIYSTKTFNVKHVKTLLKAIAKRKLLAKQK